MLVPARRAFKSAIAKICQKADPRLQAVGAIGGVVHGYRCRNHSRSAGRPQSVSQRTQNAAGRIRRAKHWTSGRARKYSRRAKAPPKYEETLKISLLSHTIPCVCA